MSSLKDKVKEGQCDELVATVESAGGRFLCFSQFQSDIWELSATDGSDMWVLKLNEEDMDAHRDLANTTTMEGFLKKIRSAFKAGSITVSQSGRSLNLCLGKGNSSIDFGLFEATAADKRSGFQFILFALAEKVTELDARVQKAEKTIESLQQQKGTTGASSTGIVNLSGDGKKKGSARPTTKQAGMSVINPGSRKRKAAKGVEFE